MGRVDLDRLDDLHQSTTPGPWYQFGPPWFQDALGILAGSNDPHVATFVADLSPLEALDDDAGKWAQNPADAEFAVEVHRLLPGLVAELRVARDVVEPARRARELGVLGGSNYPEQEIDRVRHALADALAAYDRLSQGDATVPSTVDAAITKPLDGPAAGHAVDSAGSRFGGEASSRFREPPGEPTGKPSAEGGCQDRHVQHDKPNSLRRVGMTAHNQPPDHNHGPEV